MTKKSPKKKSRVSETVKGWAVCASTFSAVSVMTFAVVQYQEATMSF